MHPILNRFRQTKKVWLSPPALSAVGGFLSTLFFIENRAPFAIALLGATGQATSLLTCLCGSVVGAMLFMDFSAGLRHCGILVLIYATYAAFRDTKWMEHPLFRPLTVLLMTASVEFAYVLQKGLSLESFLEYLTYIGITAGLCHYAVFLGQQEKESGLLVLRRRLALSAAAFRDLYNSFGVSQVKRNDENPAIVFDRAAESVCRSCKNCITCWDTSYMDTFNALNDATANMMKRGKSLPEDYPDHFRDRCTKLPEFLAAVNKEVTALLLRRQYTRCLETERNRVKGQFAQMSEFLGQAARQMETAVPARGNGCSYHVGAAWRPKDGEVVCGDTIAHFPLESGVFCMVLTDGMGSGEEARHESSNASRLLEQFLKAGVEPEAALKTINAALCLHSDDTGFFTTIDLLTFDPRTRRAMLYKYGAAPTYIKRYGSVRKLTGSGLPAGLQDVGTVPTPSTFSLEPHSYVLLISDGVVDSTRDEWFLNLLAGWSGDDPQRLVSLIMAESRNHGGLLDDCSVLCLYTPGEARAV